MKTVVVLDACVLFPLPLRDTLLRIASRELYRLHFSQEILDETTKNLIDKNKMNEEKAARYQRFMKQYFPESIVENYESLIPLMTNDPKDRHVLAAAVKAKADIIVTFNLKDFPPESLEPYGIKAQHPDEFLLDLFSDYGIDLAADILKQQVADLKKPPMRLQELIERLDCQVPKFSQCVLFYKYIDFMICASNKILKSIGYKKQNDLVFYQGQEYYLEKDRSSLVIKHDERGEILKETEEFITGNFTLQDLEKFEEFEQKLDEELQKSKINR